MASALQTAANWLGLGGSSKAAAPPPRINYSFPSVAKATANLAPTATNSKLQYSFGANGGYSPHEPFTGAWQRNLDNCGARDPSILAFSGVYACVTIISQDIAKLPARVLQLAADGITESVAKASPYHRLLRKPNSYQTSVDFFQLHLACRLIRGNAYIMKVFDQRGVPVEMHILHPDRVQVMIHPSSKEIYYQYSPFDNDMVPIDGFPSYGDGAQVMIPSRFIIHDRINCLWHPLIGTSPLFAAAVSASMGGRIMMNSQALFANMARPSGILTAPGEISDVTAERLKRDFEANYSGGKIGRTAVLGDGLAWEAMVMTSTDAQLIDQLKWTIEDVARVYRVPMYLLADMARMTYKNSEQAAQSYYSGCLQYHIEALESRLSDDFALDENYQYVAFDVQQMFRMDTQERYGAYKEGIAAGVLAPNEARAKEHYGPVKGGEEPRMQMQYVPLSTPVADPTAPKPGAAPAPAPNAPASTPTDGEGTPAPTDGGDAPSGGDSGKDAGNTYTTASRAEMLEIMQRVSAGAARAKFAYEGLTDEPS